MAIVTPFVTPFVSIRDFGAVPDDKSPTARAANSNAFVMAQAATLSSLGVLGHPIFIPSGAFYLADDLHISKSLELFGTGMRGESILMFPHGTSLIIDPGISAPAPSDGTDCIIRDLQIHSEEDWTVSEEALFNPDDFDPRSLAGKSKGTPGIYLKTRATIQRVYIHGFTGTGIYILAEGDSANADYWRIHDVYIDMCGGHGIHVDGGEAQGGLCTGAFIIAIGGNGIYESSFGGNTYVGCYVYVAKGRGYVSDSPGQVSFIGCFAEANELNHFPRGGVVWIGGSSGPEGFTADTRAFIVEGYGNVHPFEVRNLTNPQLKLIVGYPADQTDSTTLYAWQNMNGDFLVTRWNDDDKIWTTENGRLRITSDSREITTYVTGNGHARGPQVQGFPSLLLGRAVRFYDAEGNVRAPAPMPIKIEHRPAIPPPNTGEPGDIVFNSNQDPSASSYIPYVGWICVRVGAAREWKPFGKIET